MKVRIVAVNYNSYDCLKKFLISLNSAVEKVKDVELSVFIADNSTQKEDFSFEGNTFIDIRKFDNLGYFGGALEIINSQTAETYDYTIISNVDLTVSNDFFSILQEFKCNENIGWIAPSIYSGVERRDKNPQRINRCSEKKMKQLIFMFSHPFIQFVYKNTLYRRKRAKVNHYENEKIYCGHGSFIILTNSFFQKYKNIKYPCFLYCEELFLGELNRNAGLDVVYYPKLKIFDDEHVSTSLLPGKKYLELNKQALTYIFNEFYRK